MIYHLSLYLSQQDGLVSSPELLRSWIVSLDLSCVRVQFRREFVTNLWCNFQKGGATFKQNKGITVDESSLVVTPNHHF